MELWVSKNMVGSCGSIWRDCELFIKGQGFIGRDMNHQGSHKEFSCQARQLKPWKCNGQNKARV